MPSSLETSSTALIPGEPYGGIVELITDSDAPSAEPAPPDSHTVPIEASVAIGILLLGEGGLYGVRMRRGERDKRP